MDAPRTLALYVIGARDVSDFIDMLREKETSVRAVEMLRDMLTNPGTEHTDAELNRLLLPLVEAELRSRHG